MRISYLAGLLLISAFGSGTALALTESTPSDVPMHINGVETVCTGAGEGVRANPEWQAYPTRVEFAGPGGQYLGDETVNIAGQGKDISVHCTGPWLLMKLPQGIYKLSADIAGVGHKTMTIHAPGRVIVRFPNAGGEPTKQG